VLCYSPFNPITHKFSPRISACLTIMVNNAAVTPAALARLNGELGRTSSVVHSVDHRRV
jgi:hypothetical protein